MSDADRLKIIKGRLGRLSEACRSHRDGKDFTLEDAEWLIAKVERLEAEALLHKTFGIDQRKAGMEAATKIVKGHRKKFRQHSHTWTALTWTVDAICAAAKQLTGEADSREFKAPALSSPGSASPSSTAAKDQP